MAKLKAWVYVCSWLLGANRRIVGIEVVETETEVDDAEGPFGMKGMGLWGTHDRQDAVTLREWARQHYVAELNSGPFPIASVCAKHPTIRIDRADTAEAPPKAAEARAHHLGWNGHEWVDHRCGCRYHPDDDRGTHGGGPHVHPCTTHGAAR